MVRRALETREEVFSVRTSRPLCGITISLVLSGLIAILAETPREQKPSAGAENEKRFPPLNVPPGFAATLFACDPLIEYPSVIALGPRRGSLFLAQDYMTGLGTEIVRRDEIRLIEDADGDGYADRSTIFASGLNSVQGLAYDGSVEDGAVYVMHAPFLTSLHDRDGDGVADERRDLLKGLGLPPEENPTRLHCANGVVVGHDGWLYLALGDHGCDVRRPEGDRLVFEEGGILRCRSDGRDLHVFASGLRNIYDVALDEELNVFVRDNENDGGDYMIRVCHSFFGADHGYPYLYYERPGEALGPLTDLARGSSAGGVCYMELGFPSEYRGDLFFCEWGRSVVHYRRRRSGASFEPMEEMEFVSGAKTDPYGFKPTDLVCDRDGSLLVADWADGQRPKRGRGRIYRIRAVRAEREESDALSFPPRNGTLEEWLAELDSESYHARLRAQRSIERGGKTAVAELKRRLKTGELGLRARRHALWIVARRSGQAAVEDLFEVAEGDPEASVCAQAVRVLADLSDPTFLRGRLDAGRGDPRRASRLAALERRDDSRVFLEIIVALGRLRWAGSPDWLRANLKPVHLEGDAALAHAAMQMLRRSGNWPAVLNLLDVSRPDLRQLALLVLSRRHVRPEYY